MKKHVIRDKAKAYFCWTRRLAGRMCMLAALSYVQGDRHSLEELKLVSGGSSSSVDGQGGGVQGMFEGALGKSPILMTTSMAM